MLFFIEICILDLVLVKKLVYLREEIKEILNGNNMWVIKFNCVRVYFINVIIFNVDYER